jgi:TrmH family RNA methyltransferase
MTGATTATPTREDVAVGWAARWCEDRGVDLLTSRSARVREARALTIGKHRRARRQLLAEGPQAVGAALAAGAAVEVLVSASACERRAGEVAAADAAGVPIHVVEDRAFESLVSARTPQGVVAVCTWAPDTLTGLLAAGSGSPGPGDQAVLAHEVSDPGNAGALIRVADAAGVRLVALSDRSVDPTNAKCVRASAGSLFHLPVVAAGDTATAIAALRAAGRRVLAADVTAESVDLFDAERRGLLAGGVAWLFGNEAHGLPADVLAEVDHVVRIPILGRAESLNLATAAAVCLYTAARVGAAAPEGAPGQRG